jgi:phage gpG-like protein
MSAGDVGFRFTSHGFIQLRKELGDMRDRAADVRPAWDALLTWWAARNVTNFQNAGKRWKKPWRPLAPATVADKMRLGYPKDTLIRTGALRDSLSRRPLGIERLRPHDLEAGTNTNYAHFHQHGTSKMPARVLVNAEQVKREGVATSALINWIVAGKRSTRSKLVER